MGEAVWAMYPDASVRKLMTETAKTWSSRKLGAENSATRAALIEAAQALLLEEGYAAVTSRRVAGKAGLKPQLVHYYFRSMEDLLLEVLQREAGHTLERLGELLESDRPLRVLWAFSSDRRTLNFTTEYTALAARSPVIRAELGHYGEEFRRVQTEALTKHLKARGIEPQIPPVVASVLLVSLANVLVRETELGMTLGHPETLDLVEQTMRQFEESLETPALFDLLANGGSAKRS